MTPYRITRRSHDAGTALSYFHGGEARKHALKALDTIPPENRPRLHRLNKTTMEWEPVRTQGPGA